MANLPLFASNYNIHSIFHKILEYFVKINLGHVVPETATTFEDRKEDLAMRSFKIRNNIGRAGKITI